MCENTQLCVRGYFKHPCSDVLELFIHKSAFLQDKVMGQARHDESTKSANTKENSHRKTLLNLSPKIRAPLATKNRKIKLSYLRVILSGNGNQNTTLHRKKHCFQQHLICVVLFFLLFIESRRERDCDRRPTAAMAPKRLAA